MELYSRRFWKAISDHHRRVQQAAAKCQDCFRRLEISRANLTRDAQKEFLLEYELAAADLREEVADLRSFQTTQCGPARRRTATRRKRVRSS